MNSFVIDYLVEKGETTLFHDGECSLVLEALKRGLEVKDQKYKKTDRRWVLSGQGEFGSGSGYGYGSGSNQNYYFRYETLPGFRFGGEFGYWRDSQKTEIQNVTRFEYPSLFESFSQTTFIIHESSDVL